MPTLCTTCVKEPALRRLIDAHGAVVGQCSVCKSAPARAIDAHDPALKALLRALIRFHFDEVRYNTKYGGDDLGALFDEDNPILHHQFDPVDLEEAVLPAIEQGYETAGSPISLFAGYDQHGQQAMLLGAMHTSDEGRLDDLRRRIASTNYFLLEDAIRGLLAPHKARLERRVPAHIPLHRARIGVDHVQLSMRTMAPEYFPYAGASLGAPPQTRANAGRLNRAGVSFLYLASEAPTAINEVRPHPGHRVSLGSYQSTSPLLVADFSALRIEDFATSDAMLQEYWLLHSVDNSFSVPVPPDERARYMLTQLLADGVRQLGFDGVVYRSSVGTGVNYAFFDPSRWTYVADSGRIVRVERVDYQHSSLPLGQDRRE